MNCISFSFTSYISITICTSITPAPTKFSIFMPVKLIQYRRTFILAKISTYTIPNANNIDWPSKRFMAMFFFKQYFKDWFVSIKQWDGNFPKINKSKLVTSQQTCEWYTVTISSINIGSNFFFNINSDNFIQIFVGL